VHSIEVKFVMGPSNILLGAGMCAVLRPEIVEAVALKGCANTM